jgi:hypothetical protein
MTAEMNATNAAPTPKTDACRDPDSIARVSSSGIGIVMGFIVPAYPFAL